MADDATERITILLQAKDRDLTRALERQNKLIAQYEKNATRATTTSARNIESNMAKSGRSFSAFGAIVGGLAVGALAGLVSGARAAIDAVGDLGDRAARIGVDVESFQGLERGFQLAGVQADAFGNSLEIFTQRIGEAADGSGELHDILKANGIALRDNAGEIRPTLDLLRDYAGIVASASSEAEKLALSNDAFGRSGRAMSTALSGGAAGLDEMIASAREGGYVLDEEIVGRAQEIGDKFDDLTRKASNLFKTIAVMGGESALGLQMLATDIAAVFQNVDELQRVLDNSDKAAALLGIGTAEALGAGPQSDETIAAVQQLVSLFATLQGETAGLADTLDTAAINANRMDETLLGLTLTRIARDLDALDSGLEAGVITVDEFEQGLTEATAEAMATLSQLQAIGDIDFSGAITRVGQLALSLYDASVEAAKLRAQLPGASAAEDPRGNTGNAVNANFLSQTDSAPRSSTRPESRPTNNPDFGMPPAPRGGGGGSPGGGGSSTPQEPAYWDELVRSVQDAQDALDAVQESADRGADALSDMFVGIMDGSMSAKDALRGLLMELAKVQVQKAFLGMADSGGTGGDIFAALGDALTPRANGGPVGKGRSYLVGEEGPEMFTPGASGMITPNGKMGSSGGGTVSVSVAVKNGNLVPIIEQVSGNVAAKTVGAYDREFNGRSRQATGDTRLIR